MTPRELPKYEVLFFLFSFYLVDWLIGSTGGFIAASDPAFGFAPFN